VIDSDRLGICKSSGDDVGDYNKVESEIKKLAYLVTALERLDTVHGQTEVTRDEVEQMGRMRWTMFSTVKPLKGAFDKQMNAS
jgi:hypothetical protein